MAISLVVGCSGEKLTQQISRAVIEPLPEGEQRALVDPPGIDLGLVPLYGVGVGRFEVQNVGSAPLEISAATVESASGGTIQVISFPQQLRVAEKGELLLGLSPAADGTAVTGVVALATNGGKTRNEVVRAQLKGVGLFVGEPNAQVCYGGQCYPQQGQCADRGDGYGQCNLPPLDFGNVPFERAATQEIRLRNVPAPDTCATPPGMAECTQVCQLIVDRSADGRDLGIGLVPADAGFAIDGNVPLPFAVDMNRPECDRSGEVRLIIGFTAGAVEADVSATLVLETNDPDAPFIDIPLTAAVRKAPVAVAELRECDAEDPPPDCTIPGEVRPLDRVFVDGRKSYDPDRPGDPTAIVAYKWEVIDFPQGANPDDFALEGEDQALASLMLPIAGRYVLRLEVTNDLGVASGVSPTSDVEIVAVPSSRMHVELTWDNPGNDQDLHLTLANDGHRVCRSEDDCFWRNCHSSCLDDSECSPVIWFAGQPYQGPNPRLDIDDTSGLGPENINIDAPLPGRYRVYTHYYALINPSTAATTNTVRVYLDGILKAELRRRLDRNDLWRVADIVWGADGSASVELLESDGSGIGAVRQMNACPSEGFDFETVN